LRTLQTSGDDHLDMFLKYSRVAAIPMPIWTTNNGNGGTSANTSQFETIQPSVCHGR
jgi:hypothetical protein